MGSIYLGRLTVGNFLGEVLTHFNTTSGDHLLMENFSWTASKKLIYLQVYVYSDSFTIFCPATSFGTWPKPANCRNRIARVLRLECFACQVHRCGVDSDRNA